MHKKSSTTRTLTDQMATYLKGPHRVFLRWSGVSNNNIDEPLGNMRKEKRERIYNFACILGESESKYS